MFTCEFYFHFFLSISMESLPFFILFLMISSEGARASTATANALPNQTAPSQVVWKAPPAGWMKINVGGRNWSADNSISAGGVLRGSDGFWVSGFAINLGKGKLLAAQVWGLYHGLRLAWDKGFRRVKVEMDSAIAIHLIKQNASTGGRLQGLVSDCKDLIGRDWECDISHIHKQQNMVAYTLAEVAYSDDLDLIVYDNPPYTIDHLLNVDRIGT